MSATNTTTNYSLPIFIETDKPAWLVDFNGAMRSIDSQMKVNADAIATKSPILTFNDTADIDFTKSGNTITANLASGVSDKVGRALVTPISAPSEDQIVSINTSGQQDVLTVGDGLKIENGVIKPVQDLILSRTGALTATKTQGQGTISGNNLRYALNADGSIGKIYGNLTITGGAQGSYRFTLSGATVKAPAEQYQIYPAGFTTSDGQAHNYIGVVLVVKTTGELELSCSLYSASNQIYMFPSIYFFDDFGD